MDNLLDNYDYRKSLYRVKDTSETSAGNLYHRLISPQGAKYN